MLFGCQHQDSQTERGGDEHLDEHALCEVDARREKRARGRRSLIVVVTKDSDKNGMEERRKGGQHATTTYLNES